jgi:hypothetical protein
MERTQAVISRRTMIGGALVALLPLSEQAMAHGRGGPDDLVVLLLKGLYTPVTQGPDLGLSTVDLNDGSYSTTKIYPVMGLPGDPDEKVAIGDFFVQLDGQLCAYDLPGGSFSMLFTGSDAAFVDDGCGGRYLQGTFDLTVLEATGRFRSLVDGHNHMVDKLHFLHPGDGTGGIDEYCVCFISRDHSERDDGDGVHHRSGH